MWQQFSLVEFSLCPIHLLLLSNIFSVCVTILQALKLRPALNPSDNGSEVSVPIVGQESGQTTPSCNLGESVPLLIEEAALPGLERQLAECLAVIHFNWTSTQGWGAAYNPERIWKAG